MQVQNDRAKNRNVVGQVWAKYFPYWPLFIILVVLACAGADFYLKYTLPQYEASATMLIKDEKKGLDDSKMIESLNLIATKKIVENEIEVIKSRTLISEVVANLGLYATQYKVEQWADQPLYAESPIRVEVADLSSIKPVKRLDFQINLSDSTVVLGGKPYRCGTWVETPYGDYRFSIRTKNFTGSYYLRFRDPKEVVEELRKKVVVTSSSKLSTVINLRMQDGVPSRAEAILNELIAVYNSASINVKNQLAKNTLQFVEDRLQHVSHELDSIELRLQSYKSNKGAVDIGAQGRLFLENVSANDQKLADVNMQLAVLDKVQDYVLSKNGDGGIVPSTFGIEDAVLLQLLNKLYDLELQYARLKKTVAENNPMLTAVVEQIDRVKPSILENIRNLRTNITATRSNLYSTNSSYSNMLRAIPQKERDLVEISRQQGIESGIYTFLLQKREEAAISFSSVVADNRVVDKAQSGTKPVSPNRKLVYLVTIVLAVLAGMGLVATRDVLNRRILYRTEIEAMTTFPVLGEIGYQDKKSPLLIDEGSYSLMNQEFRRLRASLRFLGLGQNQKKIVVTSTIPNEGKSFIAANLGLSLAFAGKKVVVVEADLVHPTLASKLNVFESQGLRAYLESKAEVEEIIRRVTVCPNLFVITAGEQPPNPSELILSERMPELLSYLAELFDYVIVDTAPVGALSDAYAIAPLCDATLYVVRHGLTPKLAIERLEATNRVYELKNLAIIFNGVKTRGFGKKYSYGYGNYYIEKPNKNKAEV